MESSKIAPLKIEFSPEAAPADALALGFFQPESKDKDKETDKKSFEPPFFVGKKSAPLGALLTLLTESKHFRGKKNEVSFLRFFQYDGFRNLFLVGAGPTKKWNDEAARQVGAALFLAQRRERVPGVTLALESLLAKSENQALKDRLQALLEGYLLAGYEFKELKKAESDPFQPSRLHIAGMKPAQGAPIAEKAQILADSVCFARRLGDLPGNFLTPTALAKEAEKMAKEAGLAFRALGPAEIAKEKMGLLLGVGQGSAEEPRFIIVEHKGGKKGDRPVVLVGKGITFDTGGISLKPANQMEDMKYDMMGAATVLGAIRAIAKLELPINVVALVPTTENMPGGRAQKPGDVARSMTGKTVEITNTDAEGRLILGDALEYAQKYFDPQAILDFATLTGAVVVALGTVCSGVMGTSRPLLDRVKAASEATAERVWELPLYDEYEEDLRSHYADMKNSGSRDAGASKGGIFLRQFVDTAKYPWVHCDIAGSSYHRKDLNYLPSKTASGSMVRLVVKMLEDWKPLKS